MASSGRFAVNPEHLRGNNGSVKNALRLWSSRIGPVEHNHWVSVYWTLLRDFKMTDEGRDFQAVSAEIQSARNARIRQYYTEISEELHGPDYK